MEKLFFGLLLLLIINPIYTQTTIKNSPFPIDDVNHLNGEIVDFGNNEMYALWSRFEGSDRVRFYMSKSTDSGNTWQDQVVVFDTITSPSDIEEDLYAGTRLIKGDNNRLLLFIKAGKNKHTIYKYSDDGGASWTPNMRFILTNTFQSPSLRIISVVHLGAGKLILTGSNGTTLAGTKRSTDNGTTWQNWLTLPSPVFLNPALLSIGNGSFYLAGQQQGTSTPKKIYFVKYISTNTWQDTVLVHEDTSVILSNPRLFRSSGNELYIYFTKTSKVFNRYNNSNIYYSKSSDEGTTWGTPVRVTYYPGVDDNLNLNSQSQKPYIVFSGDRNTLQGLKYLSWANGIELEDNSTPPVIYDHKLNKDSVVEGDSLNIRVFTGSVSPVTGVHLSGLLNDQPYTLQLFDDGNHNDSLPGDKIYGNFIRVFQEGDLLRFTISLQNSFGTTTTKEIITACAFPDLVNSMDIRTGRIILPFDYNGNLADVATASGGGMRYDSIVSIFSQGFMLSGMIESSVWAAGGFTASRILDFQAGEVGYPTNDPRNGIYKVALSDSAFGTSWQRWKGAVSLGARYWDGNNNNVYDPIDLNQNGTWELNEDMPEILGDVSYFTVFNDGVDAGLRRYMESPKGIEIRQTIYAFPDSDSPSLRDAVFIRYEIIKKGNLTPEIQDFIFGIQSDPDLGDANDDLISTDTLRNSIVSYNDGEDPQYGANPPAIYNTILFGTPIYIPGISFTDINNNGTFENGIDTPLDTAIIPLGKPFDKLFYPGASNSGLRASQHYMQAHPTHGDPNNSQEVRNFMLGKNRIGEYLNPCTWAFGEVRGGVDCQVVNPVFIYSGDPVTNSGWINNTPVDQRTTATTDRIPLNDQTTLTYHTAIIMGRGNTNKNSITVTKANVDTIFNRLGAKYHFIPTSSKETVFQLPGEYELSQNYPNPFNPNTVIKFSIPEISYVTLKIYDNTGALVKTLLNQEMNPGNHEVSFSGNSLASGVYFYRLECDKFTQTRKMILMK
jgi:hypothetical protein